MMVAFVCSIDFFVEIYVVVHTAYKYYDEES